MAGKEKIKIKHAPRHPDRHTQEVTAQHRSTTAQASSVRRSKPKSTQKSNKSEEAKSRRERERETEDIKSQKASTEPREPDQFLVPTPKSKSKSSQDIAPTNRSPPRNPNAEPLTRSKQRRYMYQGAQNRNSINKPLYCTPDAKWTKPVFLAQRRSREHQESPKDHEKEAGNNHKSQMHATRNTPSPKKGECSK